MSEFKQPNPNALKKLSAVFKHDDYEYVINIKFKMKG